MNPFRNKARKIGILAAIFAAGLAAAFAKPKVFDGVTQEMIALFGLLMAGVLPTMVLTASVLRAGNLPAKAIAKLEYGLRRQMDVWIGLFVLALVGSASLIIGKAGGWDFSIQFSEGPSWMPRSFNFVHLLNFVAGSIFCAAIIRVFAVATGIRSLLTLNATIAKSEAEARDRAHLAQVFPASSGLDTPEGYGQRVENHAH